MNTGNTVQSIEDFEVSGFRPRKPGEPPSLESLAEALMREREAARSVPSFVAESEREPEPPPGPLTAEELGEAPEVPGWVQPVARKAPPRAIRVRLAAEVAELIGAPDWLVRDFVEADSLSVLFGDPGAAKTFVALSWSFAIAAGIPWHGQRTRQGVAVYVAGEGARGLGRRIKALAIRHRVELAGLPLAIITAPVRWLESADVDAMLAALGEIEREHGPIAFLVVDTVARALAGGDENGAADMGRFVAACDTVRERLRCAVLAVTHSGHGDKGRARGHSSLRGATDYEWRAAREPDGTIRFEPTKVKDGEWPAPRAFHLVTVELGPMDEDGRPVTSAVLEPCDLPAPAAPTRIGRTCRGPNIEQALDVLRAEIERHRLNVEASGRDPNEARVTVQAWRDACVRAGIDRRRFWDVKQSLVKAGEITENAPFVTFREPER